MEIKLEQVRGVYTGKNGACCCGCSGKHWYPSSALGTDAERGYPVTEEEISDTAVKRALNKINRALQSGDADNQGEYVSMENDSATRITIVYLKGN